MKASDYSGNVPRMVGDWAYANDEDGNGEGLWSNSTTTREAAIEEAIAEAQGDEPEYVYVAECIEAEVGGPDAECLLERMGESAWETFGEVAGEWPKSTKEQLEELDGLLTDVVGSWMTKHDLWPTFCGIGPVEKVEVAK